MAKIRANGRWSVAMVRATHEGVSAPITYLFMSDGWVLRKGGAGTYKRFERVPGTSGHGPKLLHGHFPDGHPDRVQYDAQVALVLAAARRLEQGLARGAAPGWTAKLEELI